jgi:IclR family transcriptional regulator, pca regulon regulatory protein
MPTLKRSASEQRLMEASGPDFLEALARGLRILETFNHDRKQLTLSDISRLVDLPRAVRRTLHTLVQANVGARLFAVERRHRYFAACT